VTAASLGSVGEIELNEDECIVLNVFAEGQFVQSRPLHELRLYAGTVVRRDDGTWWLWAAPLNEPRTVRLRKAVRSLASKGLLQVETLERDGEQFLDRSKAETLDESEAEEFLANEKNWRKHDEEAEDGPVLYEVRPTTLAEAAYTAAMDKRGLTPFEVSPEKWTISMNVNDYVREMKEEWGFRSFEQALRSWIATVAIVEVGYYGEGAEYVHELWARQYLAELKGRSGEGWPERWDAMIEPWDERFRAATVEKEEPLLPPLDGGAVEWWQYRIPKVWTVPSLDDPDPEPSVDPAVDGD
jgi:hypothetical protein